MPKGKTQTYYDKNPKANAKRLEYQKKLNATPKEKARRAELTKANRQAIAKGTAKVGDKMDMSHTKKGTIVKESQSKNRARNGAGNNKRLK